MSVLTRDRLDRWTEAGLLSAEQAASIRRFEEAAEVETPARLTIVAEVATYLGSVIAVAGGAAIIGPNWEALGFLGQLALAAAIAAVGFVAGSWFVHLAEAGTQRLGSFLWVIGTGGLALAAAVILNEIDPRDGGWYAVIVGAPLVVAGAGLWRNLDRPLQLLTGSVGVLIVGSGIRVLTDAPIVLVASVLWAASFAFGVLAAVRLVRPGLAATAVAAIGLMIGSTMYGEVSERTAAVWALVSATVIVVYALYDRSWPLTVIGVIAFFIATVMMMQVVLEGMLARLVAVVVGLIVVAAVAMRAQRLGRAGPDR